MYKALVRAMIRRNIAKLNGGDFGPTLAMFANDAQLAFPGDNTWSRMFREPQPGRAAHASHRGRREIGAFLARYVEQDIRMEVEDILVNGPPWNMRVAVRVHDWIPGPEGIGGDGGEDRYTNRAVIFVHAAWGKVRHQEEYEDTQRVAALDAPRPV